MINYKTNIFKIYLFFFGIFWIASFLAYLIADSLHMQSGTINFFIYTILLLINFILLIVFIVKKKYKLYKPKQLLILKIITFMIFIQFLSSLIQNNPIEWIPTLIRYLLYISTFIIFYYALKEKKICIQNINIVLYIIGYILIVSGYYQIISDNVHFVNGAYRVSGNFTTHHLAFALSSFSILNYIYYVIVLNSKNQILSRLFGFITVVLLLYLFLASHSRLLLVILFATNAFVFIYFTEKNYKKLLYIKVVILAVLILLYITLNTNLLPRMNEMLTADRIDSSTLYRIFIIKETFLNLEYSEFLTGIGLGGFNDFFYLATGEDNVAAHNDYLLMFVEGGIISLFLYLVYQLLLIKKILSFENAPVVKLTFILFFGIEVLGFLQNPHYFYQSELLIPIVLAILFTHNSKGVKNYEKNFNVSPE